MIAYPHSRFHLLLVAHSSHPVRRLVSSPCSPKASHKPSHLTPLQASFHKQPQWLRAAALPTNRRCPRSWRTCVLTKKDNSNTVWGVTIQGFWYGAKLVKFGSVSPRDMIAVFWACLTSTIYRCASCSSNSSWRYLPPLIDCREEGQQNDVVVSHCKANEGAVSEGRVDGGASLIDCDEDVAEFEFGVERWEMGG